MGAENISVGYLSAYLRARGIETAVAFDRSLFDDKQYFPVYSLARFLSDKDRVIKSIIEYRPDLVAFSCILDNYLWCLDVASSVKSLYDIPVIFGGVHPTSVPEKVLSNDCVDFVCLSEGEQALFELVQAMERGDREFQIPNLYYKRNGRIVMNELSKLMTQSDLDSLPFPDKEVFQPFVPISEYYLTVSLKGCIGACSYCSQNFYKRWEEEHQLDGSFIREKSPERLIAELAFMKQKYHIKYVDIKNNILSGSRKWTDTFLKSYSEKIRLPFRIMGHPNLMTDRFCRKLKEAGCHHIQMGVESMNPELRRNVLLRNESNDDISDAIDNMERYGLRYSTDFIVGLPNETTEDILSAIMLIAGKKGLVRASLFWLCYLPKVGITEQALKNGYINQKDVERIENGLQENYLSTGSVLEKDRQKFLKNFQIIFRLLPILPLWFVKRILRKKSYLHFSKLPNAALTGAITFIDVLVSIWKKDYYAIFMIKWVLWETIKRIFQTNSVIAVGKPGTNRPE